MVTGNELTFGMVFVAGMASFLSPCVLPIVPAYLSLISGLSFDELQQQASVKAARWRLFSSAIAFILGFSVIMVGLMGGLVALFSNASSDLKAQMSVALGVVIFVFALHMLGVFRIPALYRERRFHINTNKLGILGAFLIGAAFAFGWTPCIGPILSAVLGLVVSTTQTGLLAVYALGLAIPFLLAAVFVNFFLGSLKHMTRHLRTVEIVSGVLLLVMGIVLVTGKLGVISMQLENLF